MPFPISITGEISFRHDNLHSGDVEIVSSRIEEMLQKVSAKNIVRQGSSIEFTAGMFRFVTNWNILSSVKSGAINVEPQSSEITVSYVLSTMQLVVLATVMIAGMVLVIAFGHPGDNPPPTGFFLFVPIGWLWVVGGNYIITMMRFPGWLERGLRERKLFERS